MINKEFIIKNANNFDVEFKTTLVNKLSNFESKITIKYNDILIDAKSIINLMTLFVEDNEIISVQIVGSDAQKALIEMESIFEQFNILM